MRAALSLRNSLFPIRNLEQNSGGAYQRTVDALAPEVFNTPRRKQAWYLSTLAVDPVLQGRGIGSMVLRDGLHKAAQHGKATWLVGVYGTDVLYSRFGYVEVARANVGELSEWDGGYLMFTE
jgi:predicted N-acetyltransferase YhbS